jgi:hypothetical protein
MYTNFRKRNCPPATAEQLIAAGIDPTDLFWSADFNCWRFCGPLSIKFPYSTTGAILEKLNIEPQQCGTR